MVYNDIKNDAPAMLQTSGSVVESQQLRRRPNVPDDTTAHDSPTKFCRRFGTEYPLAIELFDSRLAVAHQPYNIQKECHSR